MSEASQPEFQPFFEHLQARRIAFPRCEACGRFHWYPMPRCPHCQSSRIVWQPVSGKAEIFSFTNVEHAFDKSRRERLPYIVALVTFEDAPGVRLITNIVDADYAGLRIGTAIEPVFSPGEEGRPLVNFRPTAPKRGDRS